MIEKFASEAFAHYGDSAAKEFYKRLKEKKLCTTQCRQCSHVNLPPKLFCEKCLARDTEWIELPSRAKLYAFTQQERSLRFMKPDCIGIVEFEGIGKLLTRIDMPYDKLSIGMELELDFIEINSEFTLHQFRQVKS